MRVEGAVPEDYIRTIEAELESLSVPVRTALSKVRRHRFLDRWFHLELDGDQLTFREVAFDREAPLPEHLADVYSNRALVTAHDGVYPTSSTSQPSLVAEMLQLLDVRPGMRILEIGTGTGYNAALLAELCGDPGQVLTVEFQPSVAETARRFLQDEGYGRVHVATGDGYYGIPEGAPYDRIIATVGCSDISPDWLRQLAPEGFILVPLQHGIFDPITRLHHDPRQAESAVGRVVTGAGFMKVQGVLSWEAPWGSFRFDKVPGEPVWCRPIPDDLAVPDRFGHPLGSPYHKGLYFFLTLESREIWYDNSGYGLADPESQSIVRITGRNIEGVTGREDSSALIRLEEQLASFHQTWKSLGCPSPSDYSIGLSPHSCSSRLPEDSGQREWRVVRPRHVEIVRLDEGSFGSTAGNHVDA
jgi:protein-L-isoaspartate(D-aspartate) O-methyltransferase